MEGLSLLVRCDQHLVGDGFDGEADGEQGAEGGVGRVPTIEAEEELVEIGLQMFFAQTVIDAQRPGFEVGEDAVDPGQDDMGGHLAGLSGILCMGRRLNITPPRPS